MSKLVHFSQKVPVLIQKIRDSFPRGSITIHKNYLDLVLFKGTNPTSCIGHNLIQKHRSYHLKLVETFSGSNHLAYRLELKVEWDLI